MILRCVSCYEYFVVVYLRAKRGVRWGTHVMMIMHMHDDIIHLLALFQVSITLVTLITLSP